MMNDDQRAPIPESFLAIYAAGTAGKRMNDEREMVRARYELCEDLASHLMSTAQALVHDDGLAADDVLFRLHQALSKTEAGLLTSEPGWVVTRLAELLRWPDPTFK
jgi:Flp pilus assembly protein TadB